MTVATTRICAASATTLAAVVSTIRMAVFL
jgi:hypothetical protein